MKLICTAVTGMVQVNNMSGRRNTVPDLRETMGGPRSNVIYMVIEQFVPVGCRHGDAVLSISEPFRSFLEEATSAMDMFTVASLQLLGSSRLH